MLLLTLQLSLAMFATNPNLCSTYVKCIIFVQDNFVNVHGLALKEGQRYHVCILANATDLQFEKFTQHLEQNSECSNGIIVDRTPPITGQVWVGSHQEHWSFQVGQWSSSGQDNVHHWSSVGW